MDLLELSPENFCSQSSHKHTPMRSHTCTLTLHEYTHIQVHTHSHTHSCMLYTHMCSHTHKYNTHTPTVLPTATIMEADPQVLREGDTLQLTCLTSGAPPPVATWSREGTTLDLSDSRIQIEGETLFISSMTVNDSDRYYCSATSSAGTTASSIDIAVVTTKNVTIPLTMATIGDMIVLECDDDLPISVETTWRLNPSPLTSNVSVMVSFTGRFVMGERGELVVFNVQPEDMGRYECVLAESVSLFRDLELQGTVCVCTHGAWVFQLPGFMSLRTYVSEWLFIQVFLVHIYVQLLCSVLNSLKMVKIPTLHTCELYI